MNHYRIYLIALLLMTFGARVYAQEQPKPVLVDEHGLLPCDDTLGRLDMWYAELTNNPNSVGLAVISGPPAQKQRIVFRQRLMQAHALSRKVTEVVRLDYVRAKSAGAVQVQLWRVPMGADTPPIENVDMSFVLPETINPFMLDAEYEIEDPICPPATEWDVFAEFLKANTSSRANIVVRARTLAGAREAGERIVRRLTRTTKIHRSRIRVFPRRVSNPRDNLEPLVEYWYLP